MIFSLYWSSISYFPTCPQLAVALARQCYSRMYTPLHGEKPVSQSVYKEETEESFQMTTPFFRYYIFIFDIFTINITINDNENYQHYYSLQKCLKIKYQLNTLNLLTLLLKKRAIVLILSYLYKKSKEAERQLRYDYWRAAFPTPTFYTHGHCATTFSS